MAKKKLSSDRKRSRPVEKRSTVKKIKRSKLFMGLIVLVIAIVMIAAVYVVYINLDLGASDNEEGNPIAVLDTSMGVIKIELNQDKSPITAGNFIDLVNDGYYDDLIFHRVINNFMIQGGDPEGTGRGGHAAEYHEGLGDPEDPESWLIPDEFHEDLSNIRGSISMANRGADTGGSQWFINVVDNLHLDYNKYMNEIGEIVYEEVPSPQDRSKHAVFGIVIEGLDVVDAIAALDPDNTDESNKPFTDVVINSITIQ